MEILLCITWHEINEINYGLRKLDQLSPQRCFRLRKRTLMQSFYVTCIHLRYENWFVHRVIVVFSLFVYPGLYFLWATRWVFLAKLPYRCTWFMFPVYSSSCSFTVVTLYVLYSYFMFFVVFVCFPRLVFVLGLHFFKFPLELFSIVPALLTIQYSTPGWIETRLKEIVYKSYNLVSKYISGGSRVSGKGAQKKIFTGSRSDSRIC